MKNVNIKQTYPQWVKLKWCHELRDLKMSGYGRVYPNRLEQDHRLESCFPTHLNWWIWLGVSKNKGTPNWMGYNGKPIKMDDLGIPFFLENTRLDTCSSEISNGRTVLNRLPLALSIQELQQLTKRGPLVRSYSILDGNVDFFNRWFCDKFPPSLWSFWAVWSIVPPKNRQLFVSLERLLYFRSYLPLVDHHIEFKLGSTPSYICSNSRSPPPARMGACFGP